MKDLRTKVVENIDEMREFGWEVRVLVEDNHLSNCTLSCAVSDFIDDTERRLKKLKKASNLLFEMGD